MQRITMNQINPNFTVCIYNLLYILYYENFGREEFFYYDLAYPVFYNVKNSYFKVDPTILKNLNETIYSNIETFRNGLYEEMAQYNKEQIKRSFRQEEVAGHYFKL